MKTYELMNHWLEKVVIGLNLCPFAKKPFQEKKVTLIESKNHLEDKVFQELIRHIDIFLQGDTTDLYYFTEFKIGFEDFYELFQDFEDYLERNHLENIQVVCFHPLFRFARLDSSDKANFVNRSPYPCIHFLNAQEFSELGLNPQEGEKISFINEKKLKELSDEEFQKLFFYSPKIS